MPISAVGHAAVLLWTLISFSAKSFNDTPEESMPVDIISTKEFRQMMAGAQNAPKADKPKLVVDKVADPKPVQDPTTKVSPKPPIEATQSAPPPPPEPSPPKAKPEQNDSKPPVDAIAEALKEQAKQLEQKKLEEQKQAEEQKKLEAQKQAEEQKKFEEQKQAEEQKKLEEQKQAEEQKKLEEQKQAEEQKKLEQQKKAEEQKKLEEKKAEEQKKREEARKRAEAKRIEDAKKREEAKKLEERIANLLDTRDPRREAATGAVLNQTPNLGSPKGTAPTLSQTELDAMRARLMNNWHPDEAVFERPDQYVVVIHFRLGRDRMLAAPPQVVSTGSGPLSQATAEAAKRAILVSQPFDMLSPSTYDDWNDLEITFNPRELREH